MPPPAEPTPDTLLQDARWVHSIAASLVTDPGDADDLTQEAAVAVLRSPPRRSTNLKGWLQTVMRNALRQRHRGEARREAAIADDTATSAEPADPVESPVEASDARRPVNPRPLKRYGRRLDAFDRREPPGARHSPGTA
jgi:DNA-directed RNA polymerase specialized sigma24 family protein